jgi:ABC-type Fe3+-hydroxamate transport system substrate-binding protein
MTDVKVWEKFQSDIEALRDQTVNFIKEAKAQGKIVCGYGASTKGNTLLQWFGLDNTMIDAIAERSPYKFGLKTIGTNIPILSEEEVRAMKPDYMLVLPWHFINEFVQRENEYLSNGGKFIVPCPKFEII